MSDQLYSGILVKNGIDLKFEGGAVHRLDFVACDPQWCEAATVMDDLFINEAKAAGTATLTIYAISGQAVPFSIPIKGLAMALASLRK